MLGVELGANTSYIVSSPWNSLATNRALIPSFLWSRSQRVVTRFLPRTVRMSTVLHTPNSASRSGQQFSNAFVTVEEVCRVLILSSRYCDSSRCQTPNVHLRAFASRMPCLCTSSAVGSAARVVGVDDQIWAFGIDVGTTGTFAPITVCG